MIHLTQFRDLIVRPVLHALRLPEYFSASRMLAVERLLVGTALAESGLRFLAQVGGGPAVGVYQMEPATHDDIWENYLRHRPDLSDRVRSFEAKGCRAEEQMAGNLYYATAMARVHYLRVREPIPPPDDLEAIARYWKRFYNTSAGKGSVAGFIRKAAAVMQL